MPEMKPLDKAFIWRFGAIRELISLRLLRQARNLELTDKGIAFWDQLDSAGYRPSKREIEAFVRVQYRGDPRITRLLRIYAYARGVFGRWEDARDRARG
jgi:hypothetical protein